MSATRILWGQLLFVSVVVLAFLWAATEWTAWRLAFQPQLGPAWFVIGHELGNSLAPIIYKGLKAAG